jgi:mannose-1-phosphate guanylyltransferase
VPQPLRGFVEKPDAATAQELLAGGMHLWNAGIFLFSTDAILAAFETHQPAMLAAVRRAVEEAARDLHFLRLDPEAWADCADISIDYAVMENTDRAAVVSADMGWSDIGSWDAVLVARTRDAEGNSTTGRAELVECRNVLVESDGPRVSAIGLEDVVIVVDGDEVLVTTRAGAQAVGKLPGATGK